MTDTIEHLDADPSGELPSGRFVLRIDPGLHAVLRAAARESGVSLNQYCARKLAAPGSRVPVHATEAIQRASTVAGEALIGVLAFGSWTRGEAGAGSDLDLLVVIERHEAISRSLYRRWDADPILRWDSHRVEPHFAHLPARDTRPSGLWAEAAVDGIVLFERGLSITRRLVDFRQEIAAGRWIRRQVHGQPYWIDAA